MQKDTPEQRQHRKLDEELDRQLEQRFSSSNVPKITRTPPQGTEPKSGKPDTSRAGPTE